MIEYFKLDESQEIVKTVDSFEQFSDLISRFNDAYWCMQTGGPYHSMLYERLEKRVIGILRCFICNIPKHLHYNNIVDWLGDQKNQQLIRDHFNKAR